MKHCKTKGELLNWPKAKDCKEIKLNFRKLTLKEVEADRRQAYTYLIP